MDLYKNSRLVDDGLDLEDEELIEEESYEDFEERDENY